ncbi:hypothetical protein [Melghirimyces algeriensis]|uniref:Uncharacterized protein n=1 Tax=Melghirimyces algeriensis TaxID=910412 RepID=A0A521BGA5_9BACL|nr:hypothetical protein [Melghirimyces algeriensis]SMO46144.1 hypothetical protein SAMN06264849_10269 [Melghirimyces algeriensis]
MSVLPELLELVWIALKWIGRFFISILDAMTIVDLLDEMRKKVRRFLKRRKREGCDEQERK